ncbi:unnamed protein product [Blepharisma stoltei]|uniref:Uncharacterized protein n=1 Tax=Blepharisma stoltei TaxID=1481888 RepID=A0AAU9JZW3_9CILI|nr:unnamed protein product [Blepharisma stoltei]
MEEPDFLGLENRLRKIVKELVEPTIRRSQENKEGIEKLSLKDEELLKKIQSLENHLFATNKKLEATDDYSKRTMEYEASMRVMESRFTKDKEEFKQQLDLLSKKIIYCEEKIDVLDHQKEQLRSDIYKLSHTVNSNKNITEEKLGLFQDDYLAKIEELNIRTGKVERNNFQIEKKLEHVLKDLAEVDFIAKRGDKIADESQKDLKKHKKTLKNLQKIVNESIDKLKSSIYLQGGEIQSMNKKIYDYLSNEYKIKNQLFVMYALYETLQDPKLRRNIAKVENDMLGGWDENLLNPDLREIVADMKNRSQQILDTPLPPPPPEPKQIKHTLISASSISSSKSSLSPSVNASRRGTHRLYVPSKRTYEEEENSGSQHEESENDKPEHLSSKESIIHMRPLSPRQSFRGIENMPIISSVSKLNETEEPVTLTTHERFDSFMPQPQETLNSHRSDTDNTSEPNEPFFMQQQIDFSPYIEEVKQMIFELKSLHEEDILSIKDEILLLKENILDTKMKTEEVDTQLKLRLYEISQKEKEIMEDTSQRIKEVELIMEQNMSEYMTILNQRKRENSDIASDIKALNTKIAGLSYQNPKNEEKYESLRKVVELLVEYSKICISLQSQDEIDRDSISLLAYKDTKQRPGSRTQSRAANARPVVSIDKQCQSCAGQSSIVMNAFKMACLAYTPSLVLYGGSQFNRKELIDIQKKIIEGIWETNSNEFSMTSFLEENRNIRCKTSTSFRKWRPSSVPANDLIIHTPQFDLSNTEGELPILSRKSNR